MKVYDFLDLLENKDIFIQIMSVDKDVPGKWQYSGVYKPKELKDTEYNYSKIKKFMVINRLINIWVMR